MSKSTNNLKTVLDKLTGLARAHGLNDTEWAAKAGLRKETLSRLRRQQNCDFKTLRALAAAVDAQVGVVDFAPYDITSDGHFPVRLDRQYEEWLLALCASHSLNLSQWTAMGPRFFMAGLAVMLASVDGFNRQGLLELAENLHPGASEPVVFDHWLKHSPLRPSRFLPMLEMEISHAA